MYIKVNCTVVTEESEEKRKEEGIFSAIVFIDSWKFIKVLYKLRIQVYSMLLLLSQKHSSSQIIECAATHVSNKIIND